MGGETLESSTTETETESEEGLAQAKADHAPRPGGLGKKARNPKSETRNKFEIRNSIFEWPSTSPFRTFGFLVSCLFRISCFGFRASGYSDTLLGVRSGLEEEGRAAPENHASCAASWTSTKRAAASATPRIRADFIGASRRRAARCGSPQASRRCKLGTADPDFCPGSPSAVSRVQSFQASWNSRDSVTGSLGCLRAPRRVR